MEFLDHRDLKYKKVSKRQSIVIGKIESILIEFKVFYILKLEYSKWYCTIYDVLISDNALE